MPSTFQNIPAFKSKPHIVVLTDICNEPDDAESLTRFLLYANEFQIDGLVATTSFWQQNSTHKDQIHQILDAYATVETNLNTHVPPSRQYPTANSLRQRVRGGISEYGMNGARGPLNEGTELLISAVDAITEIDGLLWVLIWGGANVLAQALLEIQKSRSEAEVVQFVSKLRVYAISDQDDSGPWIRLNFPKMFYIASIHGWNAYGLAAWTGISGESYYHFNPGGPDSDLVTKKWLETNIQIGPYGKNAYPDPAFIPEGDTPTFLSLIQNGLTDPCRPEWGGWGGRYTLSDLTGASGSRHYGDAADLVRGKDGRMHIGSQATIWRWRHAYQADFAARMQWTLSNDFGTANHAPVVVLNGDSDIGVLHIKTGFGKTVHLDASQSWDPDTSDALTFKWLHYREPSATQWTVRYEVPELQFEDESDGKRKYEKVFVRIPGKEEGMVLPLDPEKVHKWGPKTYHLILEVVDNATFPMRAYRRVLIEVVDDAAEK
ncbi:cellulose-binding protein [Cadophora sp. MPI-SDFR-AT-0126]|nr:cellulose-binding protein [Leotiomycetes sp. MPI-SDFR-AT-0126]